MYETTSTIEIIFLVVCDVNYSIFTLLWCHVEFRRHREEEVCQSAALTSHINKDKHWDRLYLDLTQTKVDLKSQKSYLSHRSVPDIRSQSSHTHSGSIPLYRPHCFGRGCSNTVWEAPWSRRAWPQQPSGSRLDVAHPYFARQWIDPECSPHSHSWGALSTPQWGTPAPFCSQADPRGKDCHPSPKPHFLRGLCRQCGGCWWRWYLEIRHSRNFWSCPFDTTRCFTQMPKETICPAETQTCSEDLFWDALMKNLA